MPVLLTDGLTLVGTNDVGKVLILDAGVGMDVALGNPWYAAWACPNAVLFGPTCKSQISKN